MHVISSGPSIGVRLTLAALTSRSRTAPSPRLPPPRCDRSRRQSAAARRSDFVRRGERQNILRRYPGSQAVTCTRFLSGFCSGVALPFHFVCSHPTRREHPPRCGGHPRYGALTRHGRSLFACGWIYEKGQAKIPGQRDPQDDDPRLLADHMHPQRVPCASLRTCQRKIVKRPLAASPAASIR